MTGFAENFSPIPRIAPPPLGSDGLGTLGPEAAFDAEVEPALLSALGGSAFSLEAREEGLFLGSFPERRSTIVYPVPAEPVIFAPRRDTRPPPSRFEATLSGTHGKSSPNAAKGERSLSDLGQKRC